ncbi:pyocin immunity protein [Pseudomonas chlororaphis]|uniref:Pyocin immunity protein n=2 Tax=Pseudomonas chlororaphis TaxID=587753 RepID=A0A1Q8EPV8_9PSED|nr:pyocin immunity protein [Pseudomonas chlororaphis]
MNAAMIDDLVKCLGRSYSEMIATGMYLPGEPPKGMFEDVDTMAMWPMAGIELEFWASTQRFEALYISLQKSFPEESIYKGNLPYQLIPRMNQDWVRSRFGPPLESGAPYRIPVLGMTGGWDIYRIPGIPKSTQIVFKYNIEMNVEMVVFELNEKSHT